MILHVILLSGLSGTGKLIGVLFSLGDYSIIKLYIYIYIFIIYYRYTININIYSKINHINAVKKLPALMLPAILQLGLRINNPAF